MQRNKSGLAIVVLAVAVLLSIPSCDRHKKDTKDKKGSPQHESVRSADTRDWNRFPAIVERNTRSEVIALGDVHGGYERLVELLFRAGLIKSDGKAPSGYSWAGGDRLLISTGDLLRRFSQPTLQASLA